MAAAAQPHRAGPGGPVERLGHGRSPVHDQGFVFGIRDRQPTDVKALAGGAVISSRPGALLPASLGAAGPVVVAPKAVNAPENQGFAAQLQFLETVEAVPDPDVAFGVGLESAAFFPERLPQTGLRLCPYRLEAVVSPIKIGLLSRHVRVRHSPNLLLCSEARRPARRVTAAAVIAWPRSA